MPFRHTDVKTVHVSLVALEPGIPSDISPPIFLQKAPPQPKANSTGQIHGPTKAAENWRALTSLPRTGAGLASVDQSLHAFD
ncbi:hypothetical protein FANTH_13963 [Fusarium anthophilum]|uniref:Uncharacterized protein n=1 Tax=Fusarium anthophilum TaxID=48485 RepID=A0A8H5DNL1_9HYPO|nr:hypothetical protein FANTH_13963 [Fusarium anthophilum]